MFELKLNGLKVVVFYLFLAISSIILITACGGETKEENTSNQTQTMNTNPSGLPDWELENGFGPVKKKLNLGVLAASR